MKKLLFIVPLVLVVPHDENNNSYAGRTYYLNSSVHGQRIQSALASPNNNQTYNQTNNGNKQLYNSIFKQPAQQVKQPSWYKPRNVARFNLPSSAPAHTENVCFYITNGNGEIVPARVRPAYQSGSVLFPGRNEKGFTNPVWQETYGLPAMKQGLANSVENTKQQLNALKQKIAEATQYVSRGDIIKDKQCFVPPHSRAQPRAPFSETYLSQLTYMPTALCLKADQAKPSVTAKLQVLHKNSQSFVLNNIKDIRQTVSFISQSYINQHKAWQIEPQQRYELCQAQLTLFNTKDSQLSSLQTQQRILESRLAKLQGRKSRQVEDSPRFTAAFKTTCSV